MPHEVFDDTRARHEPYTFRVGLGFVIGGWDKGIPTMMKGEPLDQGLGLWVWVAVVGAISSLSAAVIYVGGFRPYLYYPSASR